MNSGPMPATAGLVMHMNPHLLKGQQSRKVMGDLRQLLDLPTLRPPLHAMPDLNREDDQALGVPVGVSLVTTGPDALVIPTGSPDTGCGYRVMVARGAAFHRRAPVTSAHLLSALEHLPDQWMGLRHEFDIHQVLRQGAGYIHARGYGQPMDLLRTEEGGLWPDARPEVIPDALIDLAAQELGLHGHNGHFVEVMVIDGLRHQGEAQRLNLAEGDLIAVLHTGSELFGLNLFLSYFREMLHAYIQTHDEFDLKAMSRGMFGMPCSTALGREYLGVVASMMNYAAARRQLIGDLMRRALDRRFGLPDDQGFELMSDLSHVGIDRHTDPSGVQLRHRRGMQRLGALPSLVCGEVGIPSFLVTAGPDAHRTEHWVNHGMGRNHLMRKLSASERETLAYAQTTVCNFPEKLARTPRQHHFAVQNIHDAIDSLSDTNVLAPVARLKPIVTFKGAPKTKREMGLLLSPHHHDFIGGPFV